jgi:hypothetical protein
MFLGRGLRKRLLNHHSPLDSSRGKGQVKRMSFFNRFNGFPQFEVIDKPLKRLERGGNRYYSPLDESRGEWKDFKIYNRSDWWVLSKVL